MKRNFNNNNNYGNRGGQPASKRLASGSKESNSDCRVYLGNLSFKVDEETLRQHFGACGKVKKVDFITDYTTGRFYGTAFIEFESPDAARKAVMFNGQKLLGRPMKVEAPKQAQKDKVERIPGCKTIFVSRLPMTITDDDILSEFSKIGVVNSIRWVNSNQRNTTSCCGFVEFDDEDSAVKAVEQYHGTKMLGARGFLRVNLAPDRPFHTKSFDEKFGDDDEEEGGEGGSAGKSGNGGDDDEDEAPVLHTKIISGKRF